MLLFKIKRSQGIWICRDCCCLGLWFSCFMLLFSLFGFHYRRSSVFFLSISVIISVGCYAAAYCFSRLYRTPLPSLRTSSHLCVNSSFFLPLLILWSLYVTWLWQAQCWVSYTVFSRCTIHLLMPCTSLWIVFYIILVSQLHHLLL